MDIEDDDLQIQEKLQLKKLPLKLKEDLIDLTGFSKFQENYEKIVKSCFINLISLDNKTTIINNLLNKLNPKCALNDKEQLITSFNVILLLIIELQSQWYHKSEISQNLKDCKFTHEQIQSLIEKYEQYLLYIKGEEEGQELAPKFDSSIHIGEGQIVDIKIDSFILLNNKYLNNINQEIYSLEIKYLTHENEMKSLTFKCKFEELSQLYQDLQNACKSIEDASKKFNFNSQF